MTSILTSPNLISPNPKKSFCNFKEQQNEYLHLWSGNNDRKIICSGDNYRISEFDNIDDRFEEKLKDVDSHQSSATNRYVNMAVHPFRNITAIVKSSAGLVGNTASTDSSNLSPSNQIIDLFYEIEGEKKQKRFKYASDEICNIQNIKFLPYIHPGINDHHQHSSRQNSGNAPFRKPHNTISVSNSTGNYEMDNLLLDSNSVSNNTVTASASSIQSSSDKSIKNLYSREGTFGPSIGGYVNYDPNKKNSFAPPCPDYIILAITDDKKLLNATTRTGSREHNRKDLNAEELPAKQIFFQVWELESDNSGVLIPLNITKKSLIKHPSFTNFEPFVNLGSKILTLDFINLERESLRKCNSHFDANFGKSGTDDSTSHAYGTLNHKFEFLISIVTNKMILLGNFIFSIETPALKEKVSDGGLGIGKISAKEPNPTTSADWALPFSPKMDKPFRQNLANNRSSAADIKVKIYDVHQEKSKQHTDSGNSTHPTTYYFYYIHHNLDNIENFKYRNYLAWHKDGADDQVRHKIYLAFKTDLCHEIFDNNLVHSIHLKRRMSGNKFNGGTGVSACSSCIQILAFNYGNQFGNKIGNFKSGTSCLPGVLLKSIKPLRFCSFL